MASLFLLFHAVSLASTTASLRLAVSELTSTISAAIFEDLLSLRLSILVRSAGPQSLVGLETSLILWLS